MPGDERGRQHKEQHGPEGVHTGEVAPRVAERAAKGRCVEAAVARHKRLPSARALLLRHEAGLGACESVEDDLGRQRVDGLLVELLHGGADARRERLIGERQLAHILVVHPPRHQSIALTKVDELWTPRDVVLNRLREVGLERLDIVLVVVAQSVLVELALGPNALIPVRVLLPTAQHIDHLPCRHPLIFRELQQVHATGERVATTRVEAWPPSSKSAGRRRVKQRA